MGEAAPVTPSWSLSNGTTASNPGVGLDTTMSAKTQNSSPVLPTGEGGSSWVGWVDDGQGAALPHGSTVCDIVARL